MIAADTSPLIVLGKQGKLELLRQCFGKVSVPESVVREVSERKESEESIALASAIEARWIEAVQISINPLLETSKIGIGGKEAISLAAKLKSILIMDDALAQSYATLAGVEAHGTLYVLLFALKKGFIHNEEAKELLYGMMTQGFYLSAEVYGRFLQMLEEISGGK
ncbi:DUF3368 domain-containing protein [Candidatus Woesearchaeota archaeon]|nr:DUF3368 domain-containing protein [Candidatus Woesearchaeota archaeon]